MRDAWGYTLLNIALVNGFDFAEVVLKNLNPDVNLESVTLLDKTNPIKEAILTESFKTVELLLQYKPNVTTSDIELAQQIKKGTKNDYENYEANLNTTVEERAKHEESYIKKISDLDSIIGALSATIANYEQPLC